MTMTIETVGEKSNFFPNLRAAFLALSAENQKDFRIWLEHPQCFGVSHGKASDITRGIFKGSVSEKRELAQYFKSSVEILFSTVLIEKI